MKKPIMRRPLDFLTEQRRSLFIESGIRFNAIKRTLGHEFGHLAPYPLPMLETMHDRRWLLRLMFDVFSEDAQIFVRGNLYALVFDGWIIVYFHKSESGIIQI